MHQKQNEAMNQAIDLLVNHSALQVQSLILRHECLMYVLT